jgi:phosphoglycolate phosphatase
MAYKGIIFDLDGTLLDTIEDIADAFNTVLANHGEPTHSVEFYTAAVGHGARQALLTGIPADKRSDTYIDTLLAEFRTVYNQYNGRRTRPFPGIPELLHNLADKQVRLAVLSNKPHNDTVKCIHEQFPDIDFSMILGHRDGAALKPDPSTTLTVVAELGLAANEILFIGDSSVDVQSAVRAGIPAIGVTWGYRSEEEIRSGGSCRIVHTVEELSHLLIDGHSLP